MSDFASDYAAVGSALDRAFAAVGEPVTDGNGAAVLPPNAQSVDWESQGQKQKALEAADKKAAGKDKSPAKGGDKLDTEAKPDKDEKRLGRGEIQGRKKAEQEAGVEAAFDKAFERSAKKQEDGKAEAKGEKPRPMSTKDFGSSREHRRALRDAFSGEKLSSILSQAEKLEASLRADSSMENMEKLASSLLKLAPSKKTERNEAQDGKTKSLDRAFEDSDDLDDLKDFSTKYGERLPTILANVAHWAPLLREDPVGGLAKLAASMGALDQPQQPAQQAQPAQQQMAPPASPEEDHQRVTLGVQKAIEHGVLPALANDEVADQVAFVLERMTRTNDRFADLQKAYSIVVGQVAPASSAPDPKGSKSISGAPNMNTGGGRRGKGSGSLSDAIDRAFGGM